jgi:Tol biopolymer transport system component
MLVAGAERSTYVRRGSRQRGRIPRVAGKEVAMADNRLNPPSRAKPTHAETPLESWKEIATYLERDVSTVRRWEKQENLPVHRCLHQERSSVYAYPSELDFWKSTRQPRSEVAPLTPLRRATAAVGFVLAVMLALGAAASGPLLTPARAAAQPFDGIVNRQVWVGPGVDTLGGLSPDGRFLSFVDWDSGDLAVRDLTTGKSRHLTHKGSWKDSDEFAEYSVVSPDGQQVAYAWNSKDGVYELHAVRLDGSDRRVLLHGDKKDWLCPVDWSPDGSRVLVSLLRNVFSEEPTVSASVFVSLKDGSVHAIKSPTLPAGSGSWTWLERLSPDGRYVVYTGAATEGSEQTDIFLLDLEGGRESPLVQHPAVDRDPIWTPDGKKILFVSDRTGAMGFWSIGVVDGKPSGLPRLVKADIGQLDRTIGLTPSGSLHYALNAGMQDVYVADLDPDTGRVEGTPKRLSSRHVGADMWPAWSPDGKSLAYSRQRGARANGPGSLSIVIRSLETGGEREIPTRPRQIHPARWFPDGRSLLAAFWDGSRKSVDYYRIDVRTGEASLLRRGKGGGPFGPDQNPLRPDLSPDGKTIFFLQRERAGSEVLSARVLAYDVETAQEKEILRLAGRFGGSVFVSPDGRQLAFADLNLKTGSSTVNVVPVGGGGVREVLRVELPARIAGSSGLAWTPDGRHVLVPVLPKYAGGPQPGAATELLRVPVAGGKAQKLGLAMERIGLGGVHPDGRRIVFDSGQPRESAQEVWAMENFLLSSPSREPSP